MSRSITLMTTLYWGISVSVGCDHAHSASERRDAGTHLEHVLDAAPDSSDATQAQEHVHFQRVFEILERSCLPCHANTPDHPKAAANLDLGAHDATYTQLVGAPAQGVPCAAAGQLLVAPGAPEDSLLMQKLMNAPGLCGSPMPKPAGMQAFVGLDDEEVSAVADWVRSGAADD